jgi:ferrochelatase
MVDSVESCLQKIPLERREQTPVLFTAHSIPLAMADNCRYVAQLHETCRLVAEGAGHLNWELVYQSRSGSPQQPWLEPDVCDRIGNLHASDHITDLVVLPIGFISDHIEVLFDLDTEARKLCDQLGIQMQRAATVGTHPRFVKMIRLLVEERLSDRPERLVLGNLSPNHDVCPVDCCLYPR